MSSLVSGSSAPGAIMTCLMLDQVRSRSSGWVARARQKLLTKSDFRVARMSSKMASMRGLVETSASVQSFTVGMDGGSRLHVVDAVLDGDLRKCDAGGGGLAGGKHAGEVQRRVPAFEVEFVHSGREIGAVAGIGKEFGLMLVFGD